MQPATDPPPPRMSWDNGPGLANALQQPQPHPPTQQHQYQQQLRPLTCELACLSNCDGSALWKSGGTHVLAAVHGPIAPRHSHQERPQSCQMSVVVKSSTSTAAAGSSYNYEREWEEVLVQVLSACCRGDQYPRSVISVVVQIVSADGSVLVAALHAAVAALMDAGIEMRTLPTAACCAITDNVSGSKQFILDPTSQQEKMTDAVLVLVLEDCDENKLLACHSVTSSMKQPIGTILQCCGMASRASQAIVAFWRLALEAKVTRESQTLWSL